MVLGIIGIAVGIPVAAVVGLFMVKFVIPFAILLVIGGAVVAVVMWASSDDPKPR